jgi:glycosyltransferase involved in cell wall biosynthesis
MQLEDITPLIITFNEAANISRVLEALSWAQRVVVVDSGSTDGTRELLNANPRVEVFVRSFDSFAAQCNFGLSQVRTPWTLSLDADYVCTPSLVDEIAALSALPDQYGFRVSFKYCVAGIPLRRSLYPPRIVLYRTASAHYVADGHAHRVEVEGAVGELRGTILHDDRKPLESWLRAQDRYATQEAEKLSLSESRSLSFVDRVRRRRWIAPIAMPVYCLFVLGLLWEGLPGIHYTFQRTYAEMLLALRLFENDAALRLARKAHPEGDSKDARDS